jgi:hypothetical protein
LVIRPDGLYHSAAANLPKTLELPPFYWSIRGEEFVADLEPQRLNRLLRPLEKYIGRRAAPVSTSRFQVSADTLTFIEADGNRSVYTRVPAD